MTSIDPEPLDEVVQALKRSRRLLDELVVRGLRTAGPGELSQLDALGDELARVGAQHLAGRLAALAEGMRADAKDVAATLLRAQASVYLFDRVLTLRVVEQQLGALQQADQAVAEEASA